MNGDAVAASPEALYAEAAWLRRLARSLVDEATADDVVQEVYAAALQAPPRLQSSLRPWLATVLRNFVRMRHRGATRRALRERAAEDTREPLPTPEELLAQHQTRRMLAAAVEGLPEPYRATVLLCYAEGLAPSEIARRQGMPGGTVRWRLKRGLDLLRQELDQRHQGNRRAWMGLMLPFCQTSPARAAEGSTALTLVAALKTAALVTAALFAGWLGWRLLEAGPAPVESAQAPVPTRAGAGAFLRPSEGMGARGEPSVRAAITGVVRTQRGMPLPGARVAAMPAVDIRDVMEGRQALGPAATALADQSGRYRLAGLPLGAYALTATAPGYLPLHRGDIQLAREHPSAEADLVLAPGGVTLRGRTVDVGGGAVAGALVMAGRDDHRPGEAHDATLVFVALSGPDGRYELPLRAGGRYAVVARADGYAPAFERDVEVESDRVEDLVLTPAALIAGRVVQRLTGAPAAGAQVRLTAEEPRLTPWPATTSADEQGAFSFSEVPTGSYRICARTAEAGGCLPDRLRLRSAERQAGVTIVVDGKRVLSGRLYLPSGEGVPGAKVTVETDQGKPTTVSAGDGSFRLVDLVPGEYRLYAFADGLTRRSQVVNLVGGDLHGLALEMSPAASVEGVVREADGGPAGDVRVIALAIKRDGKQGGKEDGEEFSYGRMTDREGRFRLDGIAQGDFLLMADGGNRGIVRLQRFKLVPGETRTLALRLEPGARLHGRVRWDDGTPAAGIAVTGFQGPRASSLARRGRTGPDGRFMLPALDDGPTRVVASTTPPRYEPRSAAGDGALAQVILVEGKDAAGVELVIRREEEADP